MVIGHQKGKTTKERIAATTAALTLRVTARRCENEIGGQYGLPVICLIGHAGRLSGHRRRGTRPGQVIAQNMFENVAPATPIICVVMAKEARAAHWGSASATGRHA